MAKTLITIDASLKKTENWYNVRHSDGKEIGIKVQSNPKTIKAINDGALTVEVNMVESQDKAKYFAWDLNETSSSSGGFKSTPKFNEQRERTIVAQSSVSSAVQYYQQRQPNSSEDIFILADKIYNWVIEKSKQ